MKSNKITKFCTLVFLVITILSFVSAKAISNKPSGWYAGDQHVHSEHSCLAHHCDTPIKDNADSAKVSRFEWLIITDHGWMFPWYCSGWDDIITECNAEETGSFKCMRGEEVGFYSHVLAYDSPDLGTRVESCDPPPFGGDHDCWQQEVDDITSQGGMAAIAHPYADEDWNDWTVTGWEGMEIRNGVYTSDDGQALEKWKELLGEGKKITGLGNSDAHHAETVGGAGVFFYLLLDEFFN